jgi:hypothetical protein
MPEYQMADHTAKANAAFPFEANLSLGQLHTVGSCRFCCKSRARMAVGETARSMPPLLLPLAPLGAAALTL